MKLNLKLNQVFFLIKLLEDARTEIYIKMREDKYSMNQMLDFINGYTNVTIACRKAATNHIDNTEYNPNQIVFESYTDTMNTFDLLIGMICDDKDAYTGWEILGAKYALCLIKFYIQNVLFGDDTEVDDMYLSLPDKNNPNSYEWDTRGWDYNFFNEDI